MLIVDIPARLDFHRMTNRAVSDAPLFYQPLELFQFFHWRIALECHFANDALKSCRFFGSAIKSRQIGISFEGDLIAFNRDLEIRRKGPR